MAYMEKTPANATERPLMMKNAYLSSSRCEVNCKIGKEFPQRVGIEVKQERPRVTHVHSE